MDLTKEQELKIIEKFGMEYFINLISSGKQYAIMFLVNGDIEIYNIDNCEIKNI